MLVEFEFAIDDYSQILRTVYLFQYTVIEIDANVSGFSSFPSAFPSDF